MAPSHNLSTQHNNRADWNFPCPLRDRCLLEGEVHEPLVLVHRILDQTGRPLEAGHGLTPPMVVEVVGPEGFEPPTYWFVASCSIQLSYGPSALETPVNPRL